MRFNEDGQVGVAIIWFLLIMLMVLSYFFMVPIIDSAITTQQGMIANGAHVSESRIETINNLVNIFYGALIAVFLILGFWYLAMANKDRDNVV